MTLITPDLIEKAARATYPVIQENTGCIADEKECSACMLAATTAARAALTAVIPDVVDEIGKHTPEIQCLRRRVGLIPQEGK